MRVVIAPVGRRSDVVPYFALGKTLEERGHDVLLCAPEVYRSEIMNVGLRMVTTGASFQEELEGNGGSLPSKLAAETAAQFVSMRDALSEADILIAGMLNVSAPSMATQFGVQYFFSIHSPLLLAHGDYKYLGVPFATVSGLRGALNRRRLSEGWDKVVLEAINRERQYSGMKPVPGLHEHLFAGSETLYALSRHIFSATLPKEAGRMSGFLFFDEPVEADSNLESFLSSGDAPVFIWGPVGGHANAQDILQRTREQICAAGKRCVIINVEEPSAGNFPDVYFAGAQTNAQHLRDASVVIHEGRYDVASNAARYGVPQVLVPRLQEHLRWAEHLHASGVASEPVMDAQQLPEAIRKAIADSRLAQRAKELAEKIAQEDGAAAMAEAVERKSEAK